MIDAVKEYHKNILDIRNPNATIINKALDVVVKFIIDRRRVMVGGMMLNMALQLHGDIIYSPDALPDYDFYSPNHYRDAYDLGEILCNSGFTNISVIPARHITTMKVRINFEGIADITYCPQSIYDILPTIKYDKFILRHPHIQMIDQHIALSNPYANPGQEVIYERWVKDCIRYDMLYRHYPIDVPSDSDIPSNDSVYNTIAIDENMVKSNCLGGWVAFEIWNTWVKDTSVPISTIRVVKIPKWAPVTIMSDNIKSMTGIPSDAKYYNKCLDHIPRRIEFTSNDMLYEIVDTGGQKIGCCGDVANIQYIMQYMMASIIYYPGDEVKRTYAKYCYNKCRNMIAMSYDMPLEHGKLLLPTIEVYGADIDPESTVVYKKKFDDYGNKQTTSKLTPDPAYPKYPKCIISKTFDVETSEYFHTDGGETNMFLNTSE